jgi:hypothetical protein
VGIHHEAGDGAPNVEVTIGDRTGPSIDLGDLVEAVHVTPKHKVMTKAHNVEAMLTSLDNQSFVYDGSCRC